MVQRIKVQSGRVVYEASDSAYDLSMDVSGQVNVSKELNVGNDPLADGIITTEDNTDLILAPGLNGSIHLNTTGTGNIVLNNVAWPTLSPVPGTFLGATALNTLEFLPFILTPPAVSDTLTSPQLDILYPSAQAGQEVYGPTVLYQKVSTGDWRKINALGYTPVNKAGDTMAGFLILNADPLAPLGAATKQYVDNVAAGLNAHGACEAGTMSALPSCTYNNGISGVGATLTATANGALGTVGGYAGLDLGDRVLVKNQANQVHNGIYVVTDLGSVSTPWILTRASDFNGSPTTEVQSGDFCYIQEGSLAGTQWVQTNQGTGIGVGHDYVIVGTDNIIFTQLSGAGTYVGGTGINVASNIISNTGVTSAVAGSNIAVSSATGAVTISVTGTVPSAFNLGGGLATQIPFQSAPNTTSFSSALTFNSGTNTLSVGSASTGTVSSQPAQALEILSDVSLTFKTAGSTRLVIGSTGDFNIGGSVGTAGQVLVSGGPGSSPVWAGSSTSSSNIAGGAANQIPFQSAPSVTAFSPNLTWNNSTYELTLGKSSGGNSYLRSTLNTNLVVRAGNNTTSGGSAGNLQLYGGNSLVFGTAGGVDIAGGTSDSTGGNVNITGGNAGASGQGGIVSLAGGLGSTGNDGGSIQLIGGAAPGSGYGGSVFVYAGQSPTATRGGEIIFYAASSGSPVERFRIRNTGALAINGFSNTGSTGQVLTSSGSGSPPTWSNALSSATITNNLTVSGNIIRSVQTGITAAGTTLGTATDLTKDVNVVSTVGVNQGVSLPAEIEGMTIVVMNIGANSLFVYPSVSSAQIDSLGLGVGFSLPVGGRIMFICVSATQWYTLNATYL